MPDLGPHVKTTKKSRAESAGFRTICSASTSVVRSGRCFAPNSAGAQVVGGRFAGAAISGHVERDLLTFVQRAHSGAFDRADVHEDVLTAVIRLNEAEAFLAVEPLHGSLGHREILDRRCTLRARHANACRGDSFDFGKVSETCAPCV